MMGYLCSRCGGVGGLFESSHLHSSIDACLSELKAENQRLNLQVESLKKERSLDLTYQGAANGLAVEVMRLQQLIESLKNGIIAAAGALQDQSRQECHRRLMMLLGEIELKHPGKRVEGGQNA